MTNIIIDLEFTGLDNSHTTDNEIVQVKMLIPETGEEVLRNFNSKKPIGAHTRCFLKVERFEGEGYFDQHEFINMLCNLSDVNPNDYQYYGWGPQLDKRMLYKYGIDIQITDIREMLQLTEFEQRLAHEGNKLEAAYLIATGKLPQHTDHAGIEELETIKELYDIASKGQSKNFLTVMPHGHCAGMPLEEYVANYRRQADGYRYNNHDLLAKSLTGAIEAQVHEFDDFDNDY